jgi:hypothetical protein
MTFKEATDLLFGNVTHAELADRIGCSVATIRQARLSPGVHGHRSPPPGWEAAVRTLALERGGGLLSLADELDRTT